MVSHFCQFPAKYDQESYQQKVRCYRQTLSTLEDLDFADDLALLFHTHQHMQEKTDRLNHFANQVGLKINKNKSEVMNLSIENPSSVQVKGEDLPITENFTYHGSTVSNKGGSETDIKNRINKARNVFRSLNNVWKSSQYSKKPKLKLYQSCVLSTLLYGSECLRMTEKELKTLSSFHSKNLRHILRICWPTTSISNEDLLNISNQEIVSTILLRRRWKLIGHVIRRDEDSIIKTALHWTPEGKRKRG